MSASPAASAVPVVSARQDRIFHTGMAIACLLTAIVGFGPTYFYKPIRSSPELSPLLHVHGVVFTAWLVLLIVQSGLIRADRVDVHKRVGIFGAVLAATVTFLGLAVSIYGARHGRRDETLEPLAFMIFPFGQTVMFGAFVGIGLLKRRHPEVHRRFILLATICLMTPALSRIVHSAIIASFLTVGYVIVAMIHDWISRRRVHPIYIVGGVILLVSGPLRAGVANSAAWQAFARLLAG